MPPESPSDSGSTAEASGPDTAVDAVLADACARLPAVLRAPAVLRLARRVPVVRAALGPTLTDPLERSELGIDAPPDPTQSDSLPHAIRAAMATLDAGGTVSPSLAARLEADAKDHPDWWVPAARVHLLTSGERERQARAALSNPELPYVFPGELHPRVVDVLAGGDRVLTALHIDWLRKVTRWVGDAALPDARALGFWFWPHLRYLAGGQLSKPLARLLRGRRLPPGAKGMVVAYHARIGKPWRSLMSALPADEQVVAAVAIASDRLE